MAKGLLHKDVVDQVISPKAAPSENEPLVVRVTGYKEPRLSPPLDGLNPFSHAPEKIWGRDPRHRFLEGPLPGIINIIPVAILRVSYLDR